MANYGGPDPYAFRELMNALRAQGDAVSDTIDKLGDTGAELVTKYKTKRREQGIDVTDEALMAGLDWKGKKVDPTTGESIGTRLNLWEANRMGLEDRAKLLSLAKRRREVKDFDDYSGAKYYAEELEGGDWVANDANFSLQLNDDLYMGAEEVAPRAFPEGSSLDEDRLVVNATEQVKLGTPATLLSSRANQRQLRSSSLASKFFVEAEGVAKDRSLSDRMDPLHRFSPDDEYDPTRYAEFNTGNYLQ